MEWFWNDLSWKQSEWWAVVFIGVFLVVYWLLLGTGLLGIIAGRDGKWSTSKTSAALWTFAVAWAFIAILLHSKGQNVDDAFKLDDKYLIILGIPVGTAVAAAAVTRGNVESGKVTTKTPATPETNPADGLRQLVSNDTGAADLLDLQYFTFNLILLGFFLFAFLRAQEAGLPDLPDTLFAVSGVSAAGYIAKKTQERDITPPAGGGGGAAAAAAAAAVPPAQGPIAS